MALKAVFFDVGETPGRRGALVESARGARGPATARGLGGARGDDRARRGAQRALEAPRGRAPDDWWRRLPYDLDDLYPDAIACLEEVRALGPRVGVVGNQTAALEQWARDAALPADVISSSESLGARKPDPRFFAHIVELAGCRPERDRLRRRSRRQRRPARSGCRARCESTSVAGPGAACSARRRRPHSGSTTSPRCRRR